MPLRELPGLRSELERVDAYLTQFLPPDWEAGKTGEIVRAVMGQSGKRYRPRLVLIAGRLGPGYPACTDRLCKLGALVEFVHMASLVHDDIVDDSPLRRGAPTVQSQFGKDMAVYTGDLILGRVLFVLLREGLRDSGMLIGRTIEDMCRGEIGQFDCRFRTDATQKDYLEHVYGKTASMFVTALTVGGMESGCTAEALSVLEELGAHLGYLFQMRDDLLDLTSEEVREGKPVRSDFREGIFTLPVLHALADPIYGPAMQALANRAAAGVLTPADLTELDRLVRVSGGLRMAVEAMEERRRAAAKLLAKLPAGDASQALAELLALLAPPPGATIWAA